MASSRLLFADISDAVQSCSCPLVSVYFRHLYPSAFTLPPLPYASSSSLPVHLFSPPKAFLHPHVREFSPSLIRGRLWFWFSVSFYSTLSYGIASFEEAFFLLPAAYLNALCHSNCVIFLSYFATDFLSCFQTVGACLSCGSFSSFNLGLVSKW